MKELSIDVAGSKVNVAVAHGLGNVMSVMNRVREARDKGEPSPYDFIEVMACPGGCLGGGGQPIPTSPEIRAARAKAIYAEDAAYGDAYSDGHDAATTNDEVVEDSQQSDWRTPFLGPSELPLPRRGS